MGKECPVVEDAEQCPDLLGCYEVGIACIHIVVDRDLEIVVDVFQDTLSMAREKRGGRYCRNI